MQPGLVCARSLARVGTQPGPLCTRSPCAHAAWARVGTQPLCARRVGGEPAAFLLLWSSLCFAFILVGGSAGCRTVHNLVLQNFADLVPLASSVQFPQLVELNSGPLVWKGLVPLGALRGFRFLLTCWFSRCRCFSIVRLLRSDQTHPIAIVDLAAA